MTPDPKRVAEHLGQVFIRNKNLPRDLVVIMDASASIGEGPFRKALSDLADVMGFLCQEPDPFKRPSEDSTRGYNQLTLISFSLGVTVQFTFDEHHDLPSIQAAIKRTKWDADLTCTGKALRTALSVFQNDKGNATNWYMFVWQCWDHTH